MLVIPNGSGDVTSRTPVLGTDRTSPGIGVTDRVPIDVSSPGYVKNFILITNYQ